MRKPGLIVHSAAPLNAEPPAPLLATQRLTPHGVFYVRCHGDIPALDAATHVLRVDGLVRQTLSLTMADLAANFPHHRVQAVMQCAGNRRADLHAVAPVQGEPWAIGAIGNAVWGGVALAEVLHAAGVTGAAAQDLHVELAGADLCEPADGGFRYAVSIPLAKALTPDVLLAWTMNGAPLPAAHGFPLRAVVPGYAGARSAKWLARVTVRDRACAAPPQARDYRLPAPGAEGDADAPINDMPLNAAICTPEDGAVVPAGAVAVRGYAVTAAGRVARVEVTADGGRHWHHARLDQDAAAPWSWTLWRATLELAPGAHALAVRAWDDAGRTQPADAAAVWNPRGYLCTAWHHVRVQAR